MCVTVARVSFRDLVDFAHPAPPRPVPPRPPVITLITALPFPPSRALSFLLASAGTRPVRLGTGTASPHEPTALTHRVFLALSLSLSQSAQVELAALHTRLELVHSKAGELERQASSLTQALGDQKAQFERKEAELAVGWLRKERDWGQTLTLAKQKETSLMMRLEHLEGSRAFRTAPAPHLTATHAFRPPPGPRAQSQSRI